VELERLRLLFGDLAFVGIGQLGTHSGLECTPDSGRSHPHRISQIEGPKLEKVRATRCELRAKCARRILCPGIPIV
jgi:hypothetical protein